MNIHREEFPILGEIRDFFINEARMIQSGGVEYKYSSEWLGVYWPADEYVYIRLTAEKKFDSFYEEIERLLLSLCRQIEFDNSTDAVQDAITLNRALVNQPYFNTDVQVNLKFNIIEVGKKIYEKGFNSGLMPSAWESLNETKIILKAPITTPQGGGYKSLNVTIRKKLGLYSNVRPVSSFHPFVECNFPKMDVVIIRENEEDLYAGIEHRQTDQTFQCLKLVTKKGCEKIIRYAFEYATVNSRKKVTCFSKDNIMKIGDLIIHMEECLLSKKVFKCP
jgi:isocitrate dehydrogenase